MQRGKLPRPLLSTHQKLTGILSLEAEFIQAICANCGHREVQLNKKQITHMGPMPGVKLSTTTADSNKPNGYQQEHTALSYSEKQAILGEPQTEHFQQEIFLLYLFLHLSLDTSKHKWLYNVYLRNC